ncbi:MAG: acyl carrier protein [Desulfobacteraceae bacterium]|nr:acyl carrier protein [Desulfobacteraceae bacterium]MBC2754782.1 acyl carrier protein [Desulfobacteraceae bacterium]
MDYIEDINKFIIENFLFGDENNLEKNASLLENGIIDSTGVLELISFLEETYGITIEDDEMVPENLDSMDNINNFLKKKLNN